MSQKKQPPIKRLWVAVDGSIYTADTEDVKVAFSGKTLKVQTAIAFNVGHDLATHIVKVHNDSIYHKVLGIVPGSTIFGGQVKEEQ